MQKNGIKIPQKCHNVTKIEFAQKSTTNIFTINYKKLDITMSQKCHNITKITQKRRS